MKKETKAKKESVKKVKAKLKIIKIEDYLTKKAYFVGYENESKKTKKFNSLLSLLNNNPRYKSAFNKGELTQVTIGSISKGVKNIW